MFGKLAKLPLRVAHRVARVIQEQDARKHAAPPSAPAAPARVGPAIDPGELADLPADAVSLPPSELIGRSVCFVDLRENASTPGVPGAIRMTLREVTIRLAELPPDERVAVYDETGGDDALTAVLFMRARGLEDVWVMQGGLRGWQAAGGKVAQR